jgi:hypothetical protein
VGGNGLGAAFVFKQRLGLGLYLALALAYLYRMDSEPLRYLVDRLYSSHRLKTYFGLELRQMCVVLLCFTHDLPVSLHSVPLKLLSQIRDPLQDRWKYWSELICKWTFSTREVECDDARNTFVVGIFSAK